MHLEEKNCRVRLVTADFRDKIEQMGTAALSFVCFSYVQYQPVRLNLANSLVMVQMKMPN